MLRNEVSRALERCAVYPAGFEPKRVEFLEEDLADFLHTLEVLRPAVDVDDLLEQRERPGIVFVNCLGEALLLSRKATSLCGGCRWIQHKRE
jgi:hypothetical protein